MSSTRWVEPRLRRRLSPLAGGAVSDRLRVQFGAFVHSRVHPDNYIYSPPRVDDDGTLKWVSLSYADELPPI